MFFKGLLDDVIQLNFADAIMTTYLLRSGHAAEGNPIIAGPGVWLGLLLKLILVPAFAYVVYKHRPKWLIVPVVIYSGVLIYSLVGLFIVDIIPRFTQ